MSAIFKISKSQTDSYLALSTYYPSNFNQSVFISHSWFSMVSFLIAFLYDRLPTIQARYPRYSSVIEWSLYAVITIIIVLGIYYKF